MTEIQGLQRHIWAWIIGGIFAILAVIVACHHIYQHFKKNTHPVAKYVIRILFMVPVYAVEAWLGLIQKNYFQYWDVMRESYEALVIYTFYQFLVGYMDGERGVQKYIMLEAAKKEEGKRALESLNGQQNPDPVAVHEAREKAHIGEHLTPMCWLKTWNLEDGTFLRECKWGILQYVPIKVGCAVATFITSLLGVYGPGEFSPTVAYPWIAFITNASQIWAMYCLVLFYHALHSHIIEIQPLWKFLSIKLVVFMTFWQGVFIAILIEVSILQSTQDYNSEQVAGGIQDFIVCLEMFAAAVLHIWVWKYDELTKKVGDHGQLTRLGSVLSPKELIKDVHSSMLSPVHQKLQRGTSQARQELLRHPTCLAVLCCCCDCHPVVEEHPSSAPSSGKPPPPKYPRPGRTPADQGFDDSKDPGGALSSSHPTQTSISPPSEDRGEADSVESPSLRKQDSAESTASQP